MFLTETPRPWLSPFYNKWTYKTLDLNKYLKNTKCKLTVFCRLWSKTSEYCLFHCQWSYFYHFFPLSCEQTMMPDTMDTVQVWNYCISSSLEDESFWFSLAASLILWNTLLMIPPQLLEPRILWYFLITDFPQ